MRHGAILKRKNKKLAKLRGAKGTLTRRSLAEQAKDKDERILELEKELYVTGSKIEHWETIVKEEKGWSLCGYNFGIKPGRFF